jgi:hypothetical protein
MKTPITVQDKENAIWRLSWSKKLINNYILQLTQNYENQFAFKPEVSTGYNFDKFYVKVFNKNNRYLGYLKDS